jgi:hypothetical protein
MRILVIAAFCAALCGCASATRGITEQISISSVPTGAEAEVSGLENPTVCTTPCVVQAKRSADITISIKKEGYEPVQVPLTKDVAGNGAVGFAGNLLLGGVIGMGVDAATGAAMDHHPNPVIVTLKPVESPPPPHVVRRNPKRVNPVPAAGS